MHVCAFHASCGSQPMDKRSPAQPGSWHMARMQYMPFSLGTCCVFVCVCLCIRSSEQQLEEGWDLLGNQKGWGCRISYSRDCLRPLTAGRGEPQPGHVQASHLMSTLCVLGVAVQPQRWVDPGTEQQQQQPHICQAISWAALSTGIIQWFTDYLNIGRDHAYQCCCKEVESLD